VKEIVKLGIAHESHVRDCVLCEANEEELRRLKRLLNERWTDETAEKQS
jgi:hypothetical protein